MKYFKLEWFLIYASHLECFLCHLFEMIQLHHFEIKYSVIHVCVCVCTCMLACVCVREGVFQAMRKNSSIVF